MIPGPKRLADHEPNVAVRDLERNDEMSERDITVAAIQMS